MGLLADKLKKLGALKVEHDDTQKAVVPKPKTVLVTQPVAVAAKKRGRPKKAVVMTDAERARAYRARKRARSS